MWPDLILVGVAAQSVEADGNDNRYTFGHDGSGSLQGRCCGGKSCLRKVAIEQTDAGSNQVMIIPISEDVELCRYGD